MTTANGNGRLHDLREQRRQLFEQREIRKLEMELRLMEHSQRRVGDVGALRESWSDS